METEDKPTIRLVFKGLMVFHHTSDLKRFEAGVMAGIAHHKLRITITAKSDRGTTTTKLKPETLKPGEIWAFRFEDPQTTDITIYKGEPSFNRKRQDFRWTIDLEGKDFHGPEHGFKINRSALNPIIVLTLGEFYTKALSPNMERKKGKDPFSRFGRAAQVMGVDINLKKGFAKLVVLGPKGEEKEEIFRVDKQEDVKFRIVFDNTPKPHGGSGKSSTEPYTSRFPHSEGGSGRTFPESQPQEDDGTDTGTGTGLIITRIEDHFPLYYNFLLADKPKQFAFQEGEQDPDEDSKSGDSESDEYGGNVLDLRPLPSPAFCPFVSVSKTSLIEGARQTADEEET